MSFTRSIVSLDVMCVRCSIRSHQVFYSGSAAAESFHGGEAEGHDATICCQLLTEFQPRHVVLGIDVLWRTPIAVTLCNVRLVASKCIVQAHAGSLGLRPTV